MLSTTKKRTVVRVDVAAANRKLTKKIEDREQEIIDQNGRLLRRDIIPVLQQLVNQLAQKLRRHAPIQVEAGVHCNYLKVTIPGASSPVLDIVEIVEKHPTRFPEYAVISELLNNIEDRLHIFWDEPIKSQ